MQRDKLQNQYYDAQVLTNEKQDLERMKTALEQEKLKLDETIQHKEDELRNLRGLCQSFHCSLVFKRCFKEYLLYA